MTTLFKAKGENEIFQLTLEIVTNEELRLSIDRYNHPFAIVHLTKPACVALLSSLISTVSTHVAGKTRTLKTISKYEKSSVGVSQTADQQILFSFSELGTSFVTGASPPWYYKGGVIITKPQAWLFIDKMARAILNTN